MLAEFAVRVEDSRGRRHPQAPHPFRNDFQRDRDRVIHARAFRRLSNKTQVFTRRYSDHFRNRLTHTIEVAQISRTIAGALGLNVDLTEALALAHDMGHPPFGHAGEKALDTVMRAHGFFFDHNLHALRIVEDFELRYIGYRGLNLTFEVREGIIKHSRDYDPAKFPELKEYLLGERPPLEAQIIDLTDEIGYNTADLDDGWEAEILTLDQIRAGLPIFDRLYRYTEKANPQASEKLIFNAVIRKIFDRMVSDLVENTSKQVREAGVKTLADLRRFPKRLAAFSDEIETERAQTKSFLYENLYFSKALEPEKDAAERVITELFEHWIADPDALPASHREKTQREPLPRVVCDYIAGMTDNFILDQHAKLITRNASTSE
jgi:dGTPase